MLHLIKFSQSVITNKVHNGIQLFSKARQNVSRVIKRNHTETPEDAELRSLPFGQSIHQIDRRIEDKLRKLDRMGPTYKLVYKSDLRKVLLFCYHASCITGLLAVSSLYYVITEDSRLYEENKLNARFSNQLELYFIHALLIASNVLLFLCIHRAPIRIWFDKAKMNYQLILTGPIQTRKVSSDFGNVKRLFPEGRKVLGLTHLINRKIFFINDINFIIPGHYYEMLGKKKFPE